MTSHYRPSQWVSALSLGFACFSSLSVQATENSIEETLVVANRVATPANRVALSVSKIDRADIELLGYNDISDLLDLQVGVTVTQDSGMGKAAAVRIRGEEGFRTRIQLDGIDIADPSSPQISPRIEHLLAEGLQQIEVLRGPQGLLYGADAGGVIALRTRAPSDGLHAQLSAETGAFGFNRLSAHASGGNSHTQASLSINDIVTDGINARFSDNVDPDRDGYQNTTINGTLRTELSESTYAGATVYDLRGDNDYDGCFDPNTFATRNDCHDEFEQTAWRTFTGWQNAALRTELSAERSTIERRFYTGATETYATAGAQRELSWLISADLTGGQQITAGVDYLQQSLRDQSTPRERDNSGVYAEYSADLWAGTIAAAVRHDNNDDFGHHTSWRISGVQHLDSSVAPIALKAAMGTGFRAPSLYEIAYNSGPFAFSPAGDSDLREEKSRGWEAGVQLGSDERFIAATWFEQTISNEIVFDLLSYSGYLQQPGSSESRGIEIEGRLPMGPEFSLIGNLTWNETEDRDGNQRPYRPELSGAASLRYSGALAQGALTARIAQNATDTTRQAIEDYWLLDATLIIPLGARLQLNARVENLGDERYQQVPDYRMPGRSWFLGARFTL